MEKALGLIFFTCCFFASLYGSYQIWFNPQKCLQRIHERREKLKTNYRIIDWFMGIGFFFEQPNLIIWYTRILLALYSIAVIFGIISLLYTP